MQHSNVSLQRLTHIEFAFATFKRAVEILFLMDLLVLQQILSGFDFCTTNVTFKVFSTHFVIFFVRLPTNNRRKGLGTKLAFKTARVGFRSRLAANSRRNTYSLDLSRAVTSSLPRSGFTTSCFRFWWNAKLYLLLDV